MELAGTTSISRRAAFSHRDDGLFSCSATRFTIASSDGAEGKNRRGATAKMISFCFLFF